MTKTFNNYEIEEITAIAACNLNDENPEESRQNALLISNTDEESGETFEYVVFGFKMPEDAEDFEIICEDAEAWESWDKVIATAERK